MQIDYNRSRITSFIQQVSLVNLLFIRRFSRPFSAIFFLAALGLLTMLVVSACGANRPPSTPALPTLTLTATFPPTLTPTPLPLGTGANPFVIGLVSETNDPQIAAAGAELANRISALAKVSVIGKVYPSYSQMLDAMGNGEVHATWLPPLTYLYASREGLAEVVLLTNHFGVYQYGTQFLANVSSEFTPFFDPISGLSSADATTALAQFADQRPCWFDEQSASGYILPAGLLRLNNILTQPAVLAQSHTAIIRALYIKGICDFGATFAISGDPRTASAVQDDLPDVMNRVIIIWRTEAVIPNLNLSLLAGLSEANRQTLTTAFLDLSKTEDGRAILTLSADGYQIEEIKVVEDSLYNPLREVVGALDLDLKDMLGK
jgi:phosphonate transport system substrate-binding protein